MCHCWHLVSSWWYSVSFYSFCIILMILCGIINILYHLNDIPCSVDIRYQPYCTLCHCRHLVASWWYSVSFKTSCIILMIFCVTVDILYQPNCTYCVIVDILYHPDDILCYCWHLEPSWWYFVLCYCIHFAFILHQPSDTMCNCGCPYPPKKFM